MTTNISFFVFNKIRDFFIKYVTLKGSAVGNVFFFQIDQKVICLANCFLEYHISNSFKCFILCNIIFSTILCLCFSKMCDLVKFKSSKLTRFITLSYE